MISFVSHGVLKFSKCVEEQTSGWSCEKMLKEIVIFVFALAGCLADAPTSQVSCGETPTIILQCLDTPRFISTDISKKCTQHASECGKMKCVFNKLGWMNGEKVDKKKVSDHFDQFAADRPVWSPAVNHLKAACVGDHDLPAQGPYIGCPAFDVMHCITTSFIKNAPPSQWKDTATCQYPRSFAAACPVCPTDCFAPQVPYGTCNACLALPRSA